MSDLTALAKNLSVLAGKDGEVFERGARVISRGGAPEPLSAILNVIDDTVLERKLRIDAGDSKLSLSVSGRRLRGILASDAAADAAFAGQTLSREEPDIVAAVGAFMKTTCGDAERVAVKSLPPEAFGANGERGISARGLAELWDVEIDIAPQPAMTRFLQANAAALNATMHVRDGEMVSITGDYKMLQGIWNDQVLAFRKAHSKHIDPSEGPQLICLEGALENGDAAALAAVGDDVALLSYQPDHLSALLASWRTITR